jgi:hypothetical protein
MEVSSQLHASAALTPWERAPGGWVDPGTGLNTEQKNFALLGIKPELSSLYPIAISTVKKNQVSSSWHIYIWFSLSLLTKCGFWRAIGQSVSMDVYVT